MSPELCARRKDHDTSSVFCYGGEKGRSGCRGDSGSPLMVTRDTGTGQTQYRYHSTVQYIVPAFAETENGFLSMVMLLQPCGQRAGRQRGQGRVWASR